MLSFAEIIDQFGGGAAFGRAIGISDGHARVMKARDSIPAEYWPTVVEQADIRGIGGIDHETLTNLYARRWKRNDSRMPGFGGSRRNGKAA
jgi:hypothetical protein